MGDYPTEGELQAIREFDGAGNLHGWFLFIASVWWMPDWGFRREEAGYDEFHQRDIIRYRISTGGWSGNEDIIGAMQANWLAWSRSWVQSQRGGHYIFEVPTDA